MDMKPFAGSSFLRFEDVRDGPKQRTIAHVVPGQYGSPVAEFEEGDKLTLNATNVRTLLRAYGDDSRDWISHRVEAYAGKTKYNGADQDSVLVRPLTAATEKPPAPLDDTIPF
jgi:hypothetical protein